MLAPLLAWGTWLVAVHAFLWTPLLRTILAREDVLLSYSSAWSLVPGVVHVSDLVIANEGSNLQLHLGIEQAKVRIAVWELPRRIFHVTRVEVSGVTFLLRSRIPKRALSAEKLDGLPQLPEFGPVPVEEEGPDDEVPDWRYGSFSIWLENIDGRNVREVWIDKLRVAGSGRVGGAFFMKPQREVLVAPGQLWMEGMTVQLGTAPIARDLRGTVRLRLGPFDPRSVLARDLARLGDLDLEARGELPGLDALGPLLDARVQGGRGAVALALHVQSGQVLPGSSLHLDAREAVARRAGLVASLPRLAFDLDLPAGPPPFVAHLKVALDELQAGTAAAPRAARIAAVTIDARGDAPDLAEPKLPTSLALDVRDGVLTDARPFGAFFDGSVLRGHGRFSAHLDGPPGRLRGWAKAALEDSLFVVQDKQIRGGLALDARVQALDVERGADLTGTRVDVTGAQLVLPDGSTDASPGWWAHATLARAQLRWEGAPQLDAEAVAQCRDARPIVGLYARQADLPGFVAGLFNMEDLGVHASVKSQRGELALRDLTASGKGSSIRAVYLVRGQSKRGAALLTVHGISLALGLSDGGTSVHPIGAGSYFADEQRKLQPAQTLGPLPAARRPPRKLHAPVVQSAR